MSPSDLVWVTWPHSKEVKCLPSQICCEGGLGSTVGGGSNRESSVPPGVALGSWDGEKLGVNIVKVGWGPGDGVPCVCAGGFCIEYRERLLHKMKGAKLEDTERASIIKKKTNKKNSCLIACFSVS